MRKRDGVAEVPIDWGLPPGFSDEWKADTWFEMPVDQLITACSVGPEVDVSIELGEGKKRAKVTAGRVTMQIPFRQTASIVDAGSKNLAKIRVTKDLLVKSLQMSTIAQGKVSYSHWMLDSTQLAIKEGKLQVYSCDGTRICQSMIDLIKVDTNQPIQAMLSGKAIPGVIAFLKQLGDEVDLTIGDPNFVFSKDGYRLTMRTMAGVLPDLAVALAEDGEINRFYVAPEPLARSLERALRFAADDHSVSLAVDCETDDDYLHITSQNPQDGTYLDTMEITGQFEGREEFKIDGKTLQEYLKANASEEVQLSIPKNIKKPIKMLTVEKGIVTFYLMMRNQ